MPGISAATESTKSPQGRQRLRFYRGWWIVLAGFLTQLSLSSAMGWGFSFLIMPMEADLHWSRTALVGVLTVAHILNSVIAASLGPLVDRYGPRWFMTIGAAVGGTCMILVSYVTEPWQYYLLLGIGLGTAESCLQNLGHVAAIANWFVRKRAKAFTVSTLGSPLSGVLMVPAITWLVGTTSWRGAWIGMGLLTWCIAPLTFLVVRRRPEDIGVLPDGDSPEQTPAIRAADRPQETGVAGDPVWTVREALHSRPFWLVAGALAMYALANNGLFIHIAPFLASKGLSAPFAALVISSYGLAGLASRLLWGMAIARFGIRRPFLSYGVFFGLGILLFILPASNSGILASALFLGGAASGWQLFQAQVLPDYFGRLIVGSLTGYAGILLTITRSFAPLFAAVLYDSTHSYVFAFSVFAIACFVGSAGVLLTPSPRVGSKRTLAY